MINSYPHYLISGHIFVTVGILFTFQVFMPFSLLFQYNLKFESFKLEIEYGRFRLLHHTV